MTISEFLPYANDILIKQITSENFDEITDGTVVFSITVARGHKPKDERAITWAGYMMCIHSLYRDAARDFVRITDRGNPGVKCIPARSLDEKNGTETLYMAKPLPVGDARINQHWTSWPKAIQSNQESN